MRRRPLQGVALVLAGDDVVALEYRGGLMPRDALGDRLGDPSLQLELGAVPLTFLGPLIVAIHTPLKR